MMHSSRRSLLLGAIALPAAMSLGGCASGVTLADVQRYAATAVAALASVVPLIARIDPAVAPELNTILADVQTAEQAFAALTTPTGAKDLAQTILSLLNQAFTIIEGIPGIPLPYIAGIQAAQILLVTIAAFFGITVSAAMAVAGRVSDRLQGTVRTYASLSPSGRKKYADAAEVRVRAWISTLH